MPGTSPSLNVLNCRLKMTLNGVARNNVLSTMASGRPVVQLRSSDTSTPYLESVTESVHVTFSSGCATVELSITLRKTSTLRPSPTDLKIPNTTPYDVKNATITNNAAIYPMTSQT